MKTENIVRFGDPVLRQVAAPVHVFHKKLHFLIDKMKFTLLSRNDGAALAAPQIAILKRVIVISYMNEYLELINPKINETSGETIDFEGCLSFSGYSGRVQRAETVTITFFDRFGKERTLTRSGLMARCIQHEFDHLDGVLYIDRMDEEYVIHDELKTKLAVRELLNLTKKIQS